MVQLFHNPSATHAVPGAGFAPLSRRPLLTHQSLPEYRPTPLHDRPDIAARLGVGRVLVKDESTRLGLPSFKILGASYATLRTIVGEWLGGHEPETLDAVRAGLARTRSNSTPGGRDARGLAAATDGNHGRGVARMAALLDLRCTVLVPTGTAPARIDAIEGEGAEVHVVEGTYDDAVAASARLADRATLVISDTSWEGYEGPPRAVIEGYSTMFFEIDDQLAALDLRRPDVVAFQAGVGAFAAAGLRHYRGADSPFRSKTVVVEPESADCLLESARNGRATEVPGPHPSRMAGLNCGLPSQLAWPIVIGGTDTFVAMADVFAYEAMRLLAVGGVVSGESGAAGLGGLLALHCAEPDRFGSAATVLVINTEGATDPVNYRAVVGQNPAEVAAGSSGAAPSD